MKILLILFSLSCLGTIKCQEEPTTPQDVLDTMAWAATWIFGVGLYSGRQERPWRRQSDLEDLPKIYIPNELTGNEIVRALKLTGKSQFVIENNEMLKFMDFHVMRREEDFYDDLNVTTVNGTDYYNYDTGAVPRRDDISVYFDEDVTGEHLVLSENLINETRHIMEEYSLDEDVIETVVAILEVLSYKKEQNTWDSMVEEANVQYQKVMSILEEKSFAKTNEGLYALTKSGTDLVQSVVNATALDAVRRHRFPNRDENFSAYKEYQAYIQKIEQSVNSATSIVRLPSELNWENIKLTIQTMYKLTIPQVHLFQFLTQRTLNYLEIDTEVKGMSLLSDFVTQPLVDSMWGMFGYIHPMRIEKPRRNSAAVSCGGRIRMDTQATIKSPGYPSNYDNDLDCIWTITAPDESLIRLEFSDFSLENDGGCSYDYVSVYDGGNTYSDRLGSKACGSSSGGPHISTSNKMTVKFHSDGSNTRQGFQARLTTVDN